MEEPLKGLSKVSIKQAIVTVVLAYVSLIVSQLAAVIIAQVIEGIGLPKALSSAVSGILYVVFAFFFVSMICKKILKQSMKSCRIKEVSIKPVWCISALVLPISIVAVYLLMAGNWENTSMNAGDVCYTIIYGI